MHDRLFGAGAELDGASLRSLAASLDLNHLAFEACLDNASTLTSVLRDSQEARSLGVVSTPSFLIGSRLPDGRVQVSRAFSGALPLNDFRAELDRAIRP